MKRQLCSRDTPIKFFGAIQIFFICSLISTFIIETCFKLSKVTNTHKMDSLSIWDILVSSFMHNQICFTEQGRDPFNMQDTNIIIISINKIHGLGFTDTT